MSSILFWVCTGTLILCTIITLTDLVVGNFRFVPVFIILVSVLFAVLFLMKRGVNVPSLSNGLMAVCFVAILYSMQQRGGLLSAQVVFLILIPPLMVSIAGFRSAIVWSLASVVAIIGYRVSPWLEVNGFVADEAHLSNAAANYISASLFVTGMFLYTEYSRKSAQSKLIKERERSDELLLNILPESVADELKQTGRSTAKYYESVTVLFTDFSGFTGIAEQLEPQELVSELDTCFTAFDEICKKHELEKIKTIGDAYMAVSGLPNKHADHATNALLAAKEMLEWTANMPPLAIAHSGDDQAKFQVRVGLHSGPVVAGVVGSSKFQYDVWGDTVNLASRMESSGEVGKLNISESTYNLIKDQFPCTHRGEVEAKGKGMVKMFFVDSSN